MLIVGDVIVAVNVVLLSCILRIMFIRTMDLELNLTDHSNLWISRALDLIERGCNLIFALGFKTSPRKTCDGRPD